MGILGHSIFTFSSFFFGIKEFQDMLRASVLLLLTASAAISAEIKCLKEDPNLRSINEEDAVPVELEFKSTMLQDAEVMWLDFDGNPVPSGMIGSLLRTMCVLKCVRHM